MQTVHNIRDFEQLKLLSDPRRLAILRQLMAGPQSLTSLGRISAEHPARVRHHLKLLEQHGLVELVSSRPKRGYIEKLYQATARAYLVSLAVLPATGSEEPVMLVGSHDLALESLASAEANGQHLPVVCILSVGSLDGLIALRQGICQVAGCHLLNPESGEYNISYVHHLFPEQSMVVLTLAEREQGLMVQPGNPRRVRGLTDLGRADLIFINRQRGSGTRLWLDSLLHRLSLPPGQVRGYQNEARTHTEVAEAVWQGRADIGLGIRAAARQQGLEFIPLFQERYDLVYSAEQPASSALQNVLDYLHSGEFRRKAMALEGYDFTHNGEQRIL